MKENGRARERERERAIEQELIVTDDRTLGLVTTCKQLATPSHY